MRHQSNTSPLLFKVVLDLISRKTVVKDAMKKLLSGDEWQTGATRDNGGVEQVANQTWAET